VARPEPVDAPGWRTSSDSEPATDAFKPVHRISEVASSRSVPSLPCRSNPLRPGANPGKIQSLFRWRSFRSGCGLRAVT